MKYFWIGAAILCLLFFGGRLSGREIGRRTEAAALPLEAAVRAAEAGDEAGALALVRAAEAEFARQEPVLASLLSHTRTEGIRAELAGLSGLRGEALLHACRQLLRRLRELAVSEQPRIENIL